MSYDVTVRVRVPHGYNHRNTEDGAKAAVLGMLGELFEDDEMTVLKVEEVDPTPWCLVCGGGRQDCDCGPIAETE